MQTTCMLLRGIILLVLFVNIIVAFTSETTYQNAIKFVYFNEKFEIYNYPVKFQSISNDFFPEMKVLSNPLLNVKLAKIPS